MTRLSSSSESSVRMIAMIFVKNADILGFLTCEEKYLGFLELEGYDRK